MTPRIALAALPLAVLATACGAADSEAPTQARPAPVEKVKPACEVPAKGPITVKQLPEGSSAIECDAVGRTVVWRGAGVTIPSPGEGADIFVTPIDSATTPGSFGVSVSESGVISYDFH